MSKICVECGCKVIPSDIHGLYYCPHCEENLNATDDVRDYTVFDQITASPEVLAEDMVYEIGAMWASTLIVDTTFDSYEEAVAATVAKLKEIAQ